MTIEAQRPVVVGVDASPDSVSAVDLGAWEAHRRGRRLRLVNGYVEPVPYTSIGFAYYDPSEQAQRDQAKRILNDTADDVRRAYPDLEIETVVSAGAPAAVLVEETKDASLAVVGSRGLGGFKGLMIGSVSTSLAIHAHCPVIVLRPPTEGGSAMPKPAPQPGPVVAGVDGSADSVESLGFAFEEASARGVPVIAVYVWWTLPYGNLGPITLRHYDHGEAAAEAERLLAEASAGWVEKYPDVAFERRPVQAMNPTVGLLEASEHAGLLVVGSRGRGGFTGLLLGSTSRELVQRAQCPVAVLHHAH